MSVPTADRIEVHCGGCTARFRVPAAAAGKRARCPKCQGDIRVPAGDVPSPAAAADERIKFPCEQCGGSIKAPAAAAGRRVKCPRCAAAVTVPVPESAASAPAEAHEEDLFGGLVAATAARPSAGPAVIPCANCGAPVASSARRCSACGSDPTRAKSVSSGAATAALAGGAKAVMGAAMAGSPFMKGCLFSAAGAALGAGIWCGVAYATEREIGYAAWALGGLAGFGMYKGYGDANPAGGVVAAIMSFGGVMLAKVLMLFLIFMPMANKAITHMFAGEDAREVLQQLWAAEAVRTANGDNLDGNVRNDPRFEAELEKAGERVDKLSDADVKLRLEEAQSVLIRDVASNSKVFWSLFGPIDGLFIVFALVTAYRVGSMGSGE